MLPTVDSLSHAVFILRTFIRTVYLLSYIGSGRPFVKRFAVCYQTVVCLPVLSVTLVYCGQTVKWIKMKLGMQVGLGPGHTVLDGDPAPAPPRGTARNFRPMCCGQMAAWIKMPLGMQVGLDPGDCVRWGSRSTSPKSGRNPHIFGPCLLWPNGWVDQLDGT